MSRSSVPLVLAAAVSLLASPASATKYAAEFLKIPVGPRAMGMGGAFTAVADDATAPYWNPAGMVYLPYREVIVQHSEQFGNLLNHDYASAVFPLGGPAGREAALGISINRLATDDIPITPRPEGLRPAFDFQDDNGNGVWDPGERLLIKADDLYLASASDLAGMVSYARHHGTRWTFGGNLKFIRQSIPDSTRGAHVTSFGAGVDVGATYMPSDAVTIGAIVRDLTTTYIAWSYGPHEIVSPTLDTGAAFTFFPAPHHALTWAIDLAWGFERRRLDSQITIGGQTWDVRTGLEYWYRNLVALRAGAAGKDLDFGLGLRYKHFGADYAASLPRFFAAGDSQFPDEQNLDITHQVALGVSW